MLEGYWPEGVKVRDIGECEGSEGPAEARRTDGWPGGAVPFSVDVCPFGSSGS